jgi:hypothetical protein
LLLFSLLLFQYSRILYYQSCRITPLSAAPAVACDCQKQISDNAAATGDKPHSTENTVAKPRLEDVFMTVITAASGYPILLLLPDKTDNTTLFPAGYLAAIFQPPRGNVFLPLFI